MLYNANKLLILMNILKYEKSFLEGGVEMSTVFDKVKNIIVEQLDVDEESITLETSFEDLDADSIDIVELIMAIEEEFSIEIPDEDVEKLTTVGAAVEYISQMK